MQQRMSSALTSVEEMSFSDSVSTKTASKRFGLATVREVAAKAGDVRLVAADADVVAVGVVVAGQVEGMRQKTIERN